MCSGFNSHIHSPVGRSAGEDRALVLEEEQWVEAPGACEQSRGSADTRAASFEHHGGGLYSPSSPREWEKQHSLPSRARGPDMELEPAQICASRPRGGTDGKALPLGCDEMRMSHRKVAG